MEATDWLSLNAESLLNGKSEGNTSGPLARGNAFAPDTPSPAVLHDSNLHLSIAALSKMAATSHVWLALNVIKIKF